MQGEFRQKYLDRDGNWSICDYKKGQFIGKGAYSKCYQLIDNKTGQIYAAKEMN